MGTEQVYDTPWEFNRGAAKFLNGELSHPSPPDGSGTGTLNGTIAGTSSKPPLPHPKPRKSKNDSRAGMVTPTCGVAARRILRGRQQSTPPPETTPPPPSPPLPEDPVQYDEPWDLRIPSAAHVALFRRNGEFSALQRVSADDVVIWERRTDLHDNPPQESAPQKLSVAEKVKLFNRRKENRDRDKQAKMLTVHPSLDRAAPSLDHATPSSNPAPSPASSSNSSEGKRSFDTTGSSQGSLGYTSSGSIHETAFCSRRSGRSNSSDRRKRAEKERLMQRLAQETTPERRIRTGQQTRGKHRQTVTPTAPTVLGDRVQPEQFRATSTPTDESTPVAPVGEADDEDGGLQYDVPWEFQRKGFARMPHSLSADSDVDPDRKVAPAPLDRKNLSLNFGCAGLNPVADKFDPNLPLRQQSWYHGSIARAEAESRLCKAKEGTYLVRTCESNRDEYALSLKSAKGYMHMKIQQREGRWILGYFSQPFETIPRMIKYYSANKLPIKGAEHMCLLYPVVDQLL